MNPTRIALVALGATVLGALYGLLFLWRKSTRPGILAHAWSDVYGGLPLRSLPNLPGI